MRYESVQPLKSALLVLLFLLWAFLPATKSAADPEEIAIGLNMPLSGSYADQGQDEEKAYTLAIERINSQGGLLGKKIKYFIKDTGTNAQTAQKNALDLIRDNKVVMITGGSSSAEAVAQGDICQENGVVFMAALTHSDATTGHDLTKAGYVVQRAHRHTFRWYFNAWMTSKVLAPFLVQQFGKNAEYYYITADYTWGHSLERSMRWGTETAGCDTIGAVLTPLGQKDFTAELTKAKNAKPDVLALVLFGQDMVYALKQAYQMGLKKQMHIIVPLMELNMAYGAGPDVMEDVFATVNWYWGLKDRFPGSKEFVDAFMAKYNKAPGSSAACAWVAIHEWADAVKRAGSFSSPQVIKALEGHTFTLLKGEETWQAWDHQAVSSVYMVRGKSKKQMKEPWDLLEIIDEKPGKEVIRNREENPVVLEPL